MTWHPDAPQGNESGKIKWELVPYTRGRGLDLGCGPWKAFPHFIGVDSHKDTELFGVQMNPDLSGDIRDLTIFADGSMNFVYSSHTLEHIEDYKAALKEWWRVIMPDGYLCLYLPHKNFYPNIGEEGSNPDHKHDFLPQDIIDAMKEIAPHWELWENQERNGGLEYSFFQVFRKKTEGGHQEREFEKPPKSAGVVRYGAFGDAIQSSSVLAALKADGYHVTLFTTGRALEIFRSDPHVDRFIIQDQDQVPNPQLGEFWDYWSQWFDKWVNLSESVEASFLAMPGRAPYTWRKEARHTYMNRNYLEFAHELSGTDYQKWKSKAKFYPMEEEIAWAKEYLKPLKEKGPVIMWALGGSSVHKAWPHMDAIFANVMMRTNATIITVGDVTGKILESSWENEPRIVRTAGEMHIRQTLTLAMGSDILIGPETGVMNACAYMSNWKIVFLSHSTVENLTRDWKNTVSLHSVKTPCYPCHKMHYSWDTCNKHEESSTAQCQWDIGPEVAWEALAGVFQELGIHVLEEPIAA